MRAFLTRCDERLRLFLERRASLLPARWVKLLAFYYPDARTRRHFLRFLGVQMGEGSFANLGLQVVVDTARGDPQVKIGERVSIGPNVTLVADSRANNSPHLSSIPYVRDVLTKNAPIVIEDDVWIGAGVTVLPGVHIGRGGIVGAGSVVIHDVMPYQIVAGIPARVLRQLDADGSGSK
jgi:maltose O-acetyltransferase